MKKSIVFIYLSAALLLSGCTGAPPASTPPDLTFANLAPITLDVAAIEVRDDYKPPLHAPNIEHTFPTPPYVAAGNLLKKQLVAGGSENVLRVIIEDASVVREELPVTRGFMDALLQEPSEELKGKVLLRFELIDPKAPDAVLGHAR